jgi:uncharacterized protein
MSIECSVNLSSQLPTAPPLCPEAQDLSRIRARVRASHLAIDLMFGIVLIVACTVMQLYVTWRAASVPVVVRRVGRRRVVVASAILWAVLVAARLVAHGSEGALASAFELLGMDWMAALFLLTVALLAADLATVFGLLLPRLAPRLRGWALAAGGALTAIAVVQGMRAPVVNAYEVRVAGLSAALDGTVLVAVSDLHAGSLLGERWLAARVDQVNAERPDVVVLLGDLLEGHGGGERDLAPLLLRLSAPLGVWAVTGNHESHRRPDAAPGAAGAAGLAVLHDRWVEVRPGLVLAGVDDLTSRRSGEGAKAIARALAGHPAGGVILLSHTPWYADAAAADGASLMLCGHTHGGQIWPFGYLVRTIYPLLAGRYEVAGMPVIVCRGTGTWGPRMRLWLPGEILRVTLRAGAL